MSKPKMLSQTIIAYSPRRRCIGRWRERTPETSYSATWGIAHRFHIIYNVHPGSPGIAGQSAASSGAKEGRSNRRCATVVAVCRE